MTTSRNFSVLAVNVTTGGVLQPSGGGTGLTAPGTLNNVLTSNGAGGWVSQAPTGGGGSVTAVTATAPVVSSGGTAPVISMAAATTSVNGYITSTDWTTFNNKGNGTVTSVAALTLTTTGTDVSSSVATGTTTPVITLSIPTASATNRGALSAADWTTFNSKGNGTVTSVTGTAPVVSSGGATPAISMAAATTSVNGYLTSTDWTTFNAKQTLLASGTNLKTVGGFSLLGAGDAGTIGAAYGGTGLTAPGTLNNVLTSNGAGGWVSQAPASGGVANYVRTTFTATGGQTSFSFTYTPPFVLVWLNGVLQPAADYTATDGLNVVFSAACVAGDIVEIVGFVTTTVANTMRPDFSNATVANPAATGGTGLTAPGANGNVLTSNGAGAWVSSAPTGGITSVTGTAPVVSSGGATPAISMAAATTSVNGYLTSTDWTTFNNKVSTGANSTITSLSGLTTPLSVSQGGTGITVGNYAVYAREIHVSGADGNDTTGNGTLLNPVATITKALTLQTGTRLTIILHPGTYAESPTVTTNFTTIFATGLNGGNTQINGTLTVNATTRLSGPIVDNLVITGTANCYVTSCRITTSVTKSGSGYVEILNSDMSDTFTGLNITGAGTVSVVSGKCWFPTVSNAAANVIIKDCYQVAQPNITAGNLAFDGCVINAAAAASNAVTSSVGSNITLSNSYVLNLAGTGVERVSLAGTYSIVSLIYDKTNSTFAGTNLNAVTYFSVLDADTLNLTNALAASEGGTGLTSPGTSGNVLTSNGTNWVSSPSSGGGVSLATVFAIAMAL